MNPSRGDIWSQALFPGATDATADATPSVLVLDAAFASQAWRIVALRPNPSARFERARGGELGLDEALALAAALRGAPAGAAIVAIVDTPGQAYGRREEAAGLHIALACAVEAAVEERRSGRPILALLVGKAISGAFLTHGLQAGWIGALRDPCVEVHVMSAASVARITRESPEEVARVAGIVPATARDIETFAQTGTIDRLFDIADSLAPAESELRTIRDALVGARAAGYGLRAPAARLTAPAATASRRAALRVRSRIAEVWDA